MKIVAAVYSHPDYYPPTQNALKNLSSITSEITLVCRNVKFDEITYPEHVKLIKTGKYKSIRDTEVSSYFWKVFSFLQFSLMLYQTIRKTQPEYVLVYDPIPLLSANFILKFLKNRPKLWYHNHDILEKEMVKKWSISWFALINEEKNFDKLHIFSLPTDTRKVFFPMDKLIGKYFRLPNYPSIDPKIKHANPKKIDHNTIKLIYQGHIGIGHGFTELINYIAQNDSEFKFKFTIVGIGNKDFIAQLNAQIKSLNLQNDVQILDPVPYPKLLEITGENHIGMALHQPLNVNFKTAAFASNKIFEYIKVGLPVFLYDTLDNREALGDKKWAFFSKLTPDDLTHNFEIIVQQQEEIFKQAQSDFNQEFNFEFYFKEVMNYLQNKV